MAPAVSTRRRTLTVFPQSRSAKPGAHKVEGAFYVWRASELREVLGECLRRSRSRFGIEESGNAPADPQGEFTGKNLLYTARSVAEIAGEPGDRRRRDRCAGAGPRRLVWRAAEAATAPSGRQGADRVERADDCRLRAGVTRVARRGIRSTKRTRNTIGRSRRAPRSFSTTSFGIRRR